MKIALVGFGRMGQEVERQALRLGHEISMRFELGLELTEEVDLHDAQVLIDFSTAAAVKSTLSMAAQRSLPVVEGTTGWVPDLEAVRRIPGLTMIYSPNFSMGVYHFQQLVRMAGRLYGSASVYDAYVHEWHHTGKADSPSGTAITLANALLEEMPQKKELLLQTAEHKIAPHALHVTSTRAGSIPGTHEIGFDSPYDQIILRHQAFGREAFAYGALMAASWIIGRKGIFTMDDFMAEQS